MTASSPGHVRVSSLTSQGAVHASAAGNLIASSGISAPYVDLSSVGSTSGLQASAKGSTPGLALQANWFRLQHLNGAIVDVSPFGASSTNEVVLVAGLGSYLSVSNAAGKLTLAGDLSANHLILSAQTLNIEGTIHGLKSGDVFSTIALSSDTGLILADSPTNAGVLTVKTKGSLLLQNLTASDQISLVAQDSIIAHNLITPFLAAFTQGDINITVPFQIDAQVVAGSKGNVNITSAGGLTLGGHAGIPTYGKNITVTAFGSLTAQGPVVAFGDLRMSSSDLLNNSGTITLNSLVSSAGNATIAATTLTQTGGLLRAGNGLTLNVSGDIGTTDRPVITDIPSVSFPYSATGQQGNVYMLNLGTASSVTINPSGLSSSLAFNGANFLFDAVGSNIVVKGDITTGLSDAITLASAGGYSINLYGNLTSPAINLVALSSQAGNGGAIVQNSGSIITNQLNLIVGSGGAYSIASNQAIALGPMSGSTNVNVLAQSAGSVFLNSTTPLSSITLTGIGLTNSNSTFFAAAQGDILTTAIVTASSIQLASVSGNIGSAGTAANLNSSSSTSALQLNVSAPNGFINAAASNSAILLNNAVTATSGIASSLQVESSGDLTVTAPISSQYVALTSGGSVSTSGAISSGTLVLQAYGNITSSANLQAGTMLLTSSTGSVGQAGSPVNVTAGNLIVQVAGQGSAFLSASGNITLAPLSLPQINLQDESFVGGTLSLASSGTITVPRPIAAGSISLQAGTGMILGSLRSQNGNVNLTSSTGVIAVGNNAIIAANGGNLTILNQDVQNGSISIGTGATLSASQTGSTVGQVTIAVSSSAAVGKIDGITPNLSLVQVTGFSGNVYWGAAGVNLSTPQNTISLQGGDVVFSAPNSNAISLNGSVTINSASSTPSSFIDSIDLSSAADVNTIVSLQQRGILGGTLVPVFAGATLTALSGTVIVNPYNLTSRGLNALNVSTPSSATDSVKVEFIGFNEKTPLTVNLTAASSTNTVAIGNNSTLNIAGNGPDRLQVNIKSSLPNSALSVMDTGNLIVSGKTTVTVQGTAAVDGSITNFHNLNLVSSGLQRTTATGVGSLTIQGGTLNITSTTNIGSNSLPYNVTVVNPGKGALGLTATGDAFISAATALSFADSKVSGNLTASATASPGQSAMSTLGGATIIAAQLNLTAPSGNIGVSASNRLITDAGLLTAVASNGSVFIHTRGSVSISGVNSASSSSGGNPQTAYFDLLANGTISSSGGPSITATNVAMRSTGESLNYTGTINVNLANPAIQTGVELRAFKSITDIGVVTGTLAPNPTSLKITSDSGDIGSATTRLDISTTGTGAVTLIAPQGNIYANASNITLSGASNSGGIFDLTAADLTVSGTINGGTINIAASTLSFGSSGSLVSSGAVNIATSQISGGHVVAADLISISNSNAAIPAVIQGVDLTSKSTTLAYGIALSSANALQLMGNNTLTGSAQLSSSLALMLGSSATGTQVNVSGNLQILAPEVQAYAGSPAVVNAGGTIAIGSPGTPLSFAPQTGSAGPLAIQLNASALQLSASSITVQTSLTVSNTGSTAIETTNLLNSGIISAKNIAISLLGGGLLSNNGAISAGSSISISNSAATSTFSLNLANASLLSATNISFSSTNGAPLNVSGASTITANSVTFDAGENTLTVSLASLPALVNATGGTISINTSSGGLNLGTVMASSQTAPPGITISAPGAVSFGNMTAAGGTISVTGSTLAQSSGTLTAATVNLTSTAGAIGAQLAPVSLATTNLQLTTAAGQDTFLSSSGNLVLNNVSASGNFSVVAGSLTVSVPLTLNQVSLVTTIGNLTINSSVSASSITLKASAGGIAGTGSLAAPVTTMNAAGNLGSSSSRFQLATAGIPAARLVANSTSGSVFLSANSDLVLGGASTAGRAFDLLVQGNFSQLNGSSSISADSVSISTVGNSVLIAPVSATSSLSLSAQNLTIPAGENLTSGGTINITIGNQSGVLDGTLTIFGLLTARGRQTTNDLNITGLGTLTFAGTAQLNPSPGRQALLSAAGGIIFASGATVTVPEGNLIIRSPQLQGPLASVTVSNGSLLIQNTESLEIGSGSGSLIPTSLTLTAGTINVRSDRFTVDQAASLITNGRFYAKQRQAMIDGMIAGRDRVRIVATGSSLDLNGSLSSSDSNVEVIVNGPSATITGTISAPNGGASIAGTAQKPFNATINGAVTAKHNVAVTAKSDLTINLNHDIVAGSILFGADGNVLAQGNSNLQSTGQLFTSGSGAVTVAARSISGLIKARGTSINVSSTQGNLSFDSAVSTTGSQPGAISVTALAGQIFGNSFTAPGGMLSLSSNGDISAAVGVLGAATIDLSSSAGNIGSQAQPVQVKVATSGPGSTVNLHANAAQNIFVSGLTGVTLANGTSSAAGGTLSLSAPSLSTSPGAQASAASIVLQAGSANIGSSNAPFSISGANLTVISPQGSSYVSNTQPGGLTISGAGSNVLNTVQIHSAGNIFNSNGPIQANEVRLFASAGGSIGSSTTPLAVHTPNLAIGTTQGGSAYITDSYQGLTKLEGGFVGGALVLNSSGPLQATGRLEAANVGINSSYGMRVGSITANNGNLSLTATYGLLEVTANSRLLANEGNLQLQNINGVINLDNAVKITGRTTAGAPGRVNIFVGNAPPAEIPGAPQANVSVQESNLGLVFMGSYGVAAAGPTNTIKSDGGKVVFDVSNRPGAISLLGGVEVSSKSNQPPVPFINSLDLTDPLAVPVVTSLQDEGHLGGTLNVNGGTATGTIIASPARFQTLSALNIPTGVTTTMVGFDAANPLSVSITNTSTTLSYLVDGVQRFTGASSQTSVVNIVTTQAQPALIVNGTLTASGQLTISSGGTTQINGSLSASGLALTASSGGFALGAAGTVSSGSASITTSAGSITSAGGTINVGSLSLSSAADIGASGAALSVNSSSLGFIATNNAYINSIGAVQLTGAQAGTAISLISSGQITAANGVTVTAPTVMLSASVSGNIGFSAQQPLLTSTGNLNAVATSGSVYIAQASSLALSGVSSASGVFEVLTGGNLNVTGSVSSTSIAFNLTGAGPNQFANSGQLISTGSGNSITVQSLSGVLELAGAGTISPGSGNTVTFVAPSGISLANALNQTVSTGNFDLETNNLNGQGGVATISALSGSGTVNAPSGSLSIGSTGGNTQINLNSSQLTVSAGDITIASAVGVSTVGQVTYNALTFTNNGQVSATGNLSVVLNSGGTASVDGSVISSAGNLTFTNASSLASATGGQSLSINLGSSALLSAAANISLLPESGAATVVSGTGALNAGGKVIINSGVSQSTLTAGSINGIMEITAGSASVVAAGGNVAIGDSTILSLVPGTQTSATALQVSAQTGSITIVGKVFSPAGPMALQAANGITTSGSGALQGPALSVSTASGDIGSAGNPLQIDSGALTAAASSATGNVFINANSKVVLIGSSSAGLSGSFNLSAGSSLVVASSASISANQTNLSTSHESISVYGTVAGTGVNSSIVLTAKQSIGAAGKNMALSADSVSLEAINGNIVGDVGTTYLGVDTGNLIVNAGATARIARVTPGSLTIVAPSSAGFRLDLLAAGTLGSLPGAPVSAPLLRLQSTASGFAFQADVSGSQSIDIFASSGITSANFGSLNNGNSIPILSMSSTNGDVGTSSASPFVANAHAARLYAPNGNVFFRSTDPLGLQLFSDSGAMNSFEVSAAGDLAVLIGPSLSASNVALTSTGGKFDTAAPINAANTLTITAAGNITTSVSGALKALEGTVVLNSQAGSIGTDIILNRVAVTASNLVANAGAANQNVYINAAGSINIGPGSSSAGNIFDIIASKALSTTGSIIASTVSLVAVSGDLTIGSSVNAPQSILLSSPRDINASHLANLNGGLTSGEVVLTSTTGNIGTASQRLTVNTQNLSALANRGSVYIFNNNALNISRDSSAANVFDLQATGPITSAAGTSISAKHVVLQSTGAGFAMLGAVLGSSSTTLHANGSLVNADFANIDNGASNRLFLISDNGNIGSSATSPFSVSADTLSISAPNGSLFASNSSGQVTVTGGMVSGGLVDVVASGDVSVQGTVNSSTTRLISGLGSVLVHDDLSGHLSVEISAQKGSIATRNISANGLLPGDDGGSINLSAAGAIMTRNISASANGTGSGGSVAITTGAVVATGDINVTGSGAGNSAGSVNITMVSGRSLPNYAVRIFTSIGGNTTVYSNLSKTLVHFPAVGGDYMKDIVFVGDSKVLPSSVVLGSVSATGIANASGGSINVSTGIGTLLAGALEARAVGTGTGGSVNTLSQQVQISGKSATGNSIDTSSSGGSSGTISLSTYIFNPLVVGGVTGANYVAGNIASNGAIDGGSISLINGAGQNVLTGASITANGGPGAGGLILLTTPYAGSIGEFLNVDGLIQATNQSGTSGTIGLNGGLNTGVFVTGSGTIFAGQYVSMGNLAGLLPVNLASGGIISVAPSVTIRGVLLSNPGYYFPQQPVPAPVATAVRLPGMPPLPGSRPNSTILPTDVIRLTARVANEEDESDELENSPLDNHRESEQVLLSGPVNFSSDRIARLTARGLKIGPGTGGNFLRLEKGKILLAPSDKIQVRTQECTVYIAKGAVVYIVETGSDVAVYNMHDDHLGSVEVLVGRKLITLAPGKQLVFTRKGKSEFDDINPEARIAYRKESLLGTIDDVTVYTADFSITSALNQVVPLQQMLSSSDIVERKTARRLMKMAVISFMISPGGNPYRSGRAR